MLLVIAGIVASSPSSSQYIGGRKDGLNLDTNIDMDTVERVATFEDVRHTFTSDFKLDPSCPTKIQFMSEPVVDRNIGKMPIRDIKEDGKRCKGEYDISSFKLVSEATVKSGTLLKTLGYGRAYDAIRKNSAALAIVQNNKPDSSLLVGFDEGTRTCGKSKYGEETFWFFIREPNTFRIIIRVGDNARLTNITVPKDKRALFVTDGKKKLCLLSDKSTAKGKKVLIQKENGKPTPSPPSKSKKSPPSAQVTPSTSADDGSKKSEPAAQVSDAPMAVEEIEASLEPSPEAKKNVCFPAHANVELENGSTLPISDLRIGDRVRTGKDTFSDVFMFSHRDMDVRSEFVRITTKSGVDVVLTPSHYLYSHGKLVSAGSVKKSDQLSLGDGTFSQVESVERVVAKGLYNPHTLDGNIVVDGVITSTYTTSVHPILAHGGLLSPLRWMYAFGATRNYHFNNYIKILDSVATFVGKSADGLSAIVPSGPAQIE